MKNSNGIWGLSLLICIVLLSLGCTTTRTPVDSSTPACIGVWINTQYNTQNRKAAKIVYYPDMTWEAFEYDYSREPAWRGTISIVDSWNDEEGCCWYKITTNQLGLSFVAYELWRIGEEGTVLEGIWSTGIMPEYLDQENNTYTVYYRQNNLARIVKADQ